MGTPAVTRGRSAPARCAQREGEGTRDPHKLNCVCWALMDCLASPEIGDCQRNIDKPSEERVKELEETVLNLSAQNEVISLCICVCLPPFTTLRNPLQYSIS